MMKNWKPKLKRCKSAECQEFFMPGRPLQMVCSPMCGVKYSQQLQKKKEDKDWREKKKVMVEKLMTIGEYKALARAVFQKWIRMRDKDLVCISCGNAKTDKWDAGHFLKAELYSGLIFHEENCHKQCKQCNNWLGGNELNYRIGLVKKIGEDRVRWLEDNKDRLRVYDFTKHELVEIREKYKVKIKELNEAEKVHTAGLV